MNSVNRNAKVFFIILFAIYGTIGFPQVDSPYKVPLTEFGHPDLQGVWTDQSMTPLERPDSLGLKSTYSIQEVNELEQARLIATERASQPLIPDRSPPPLGGVITQQSDVNFNGLVTRFIPVFGAVSYTHLTLPTKA